MTYKRVLLKLSGEALMGAQPFGVSPEICRQVARSICAASQRGVQIALVVGGGNIFRGIQGVASGMERVTSDQVGMLGTMINGLMLQQSLEMEGCRVKVLNAFPLEGVTEIYHWNRAVSYLESGTIVICVGGTGLPYFTTDTAAALRAIEIKADILLKATKVDGVYDKDPLKHPEAKKYSSLTQGEMLSKNLAVMDAAAAALCRDQKLPILVFDLFAENSLQKALFENNFGTLVLPN